MIKWKKTDPIKGWPKNIDMWTFSRTTNENVNWFNHFGTLAVSTKVSKYIC